MTSAHPRAGTFAAALRNFEETGDSSQLREPFGEDPELIRPQVATGDDVTAVARFWEEYRGTSLLAFDDHAWYAGSPRTSTRRPSCGPRPRLDDHRTWQEAPRCPRDTSFTGSHVT